jgi:hypothetical protein
VSKASVSEESEKRQIYRIYISHINFRFGKSTHQVTIATFGTPIADEFITDAEDPPAKIARLGKGPVAVVEVARPSAYLVNFDLVVVDGCRLPFNAGRMLKVAVDGSDRGINLVEMDHGRILKSEG